MRIGSSVVKSLGFSTPAPDESTVLTETLFYAGAVQEGQSNGGLSDPSSTDESDWVRFSARPMISSIKSPRPKQALGGGGGGSPGMLNESTVDWNHQ